MLVEYHVAEKPKTVCAICKYGQTFMRRKESGALPKDHEDPVHRVQLQSFAWCEAPEVRMSLGWSVVTGVERCEFPLCVAVNTSGNCPYYQMIEDPPLSTFPDLQPPAKSYKALAEEEE